MNSADTRPSLSQVKRAIKKRVVFTPNNRCYHLPCLTSSPWCELRVSLDTSTPVPDSTRRERWCAGSRLEEDGQRWHLLPNMGNCIKESVIDSRGNSWRRKRLIWDWLYEITVIQQSAQRLVDADPMVDCSWSDGRSCPGPTPGAAGGRGLLYLMVPLLAAIIRFGWRCGGEWPS